MKAFLCENFTKHTNLVSHSFDYPKKDGLFLPEQYCNFFLLSYDLIKINVLMQLYMLFCSASIFYSMDFNPRSVVEFLPNKREPPENGLMC